MPSVLEPPATAALLLGLLVTSGACKKDETTEVTAQAAPESPQTEQRRECERFATDMAQTGALAGQILSQLAGLADPRDGARRRPGLGS